MLSKYKITNQRLTLKVEENTDAYDKVDELTKKFTSLSSLHKIKTLEFTATKRKLMGKLT